MRGRGRQRGRQTDRQRSEEMEERDIRQHDRDTEIESELSPDPIPRADVCWGGQRMVQVTIRDASHLESRDRCLAPNVLKTNGHGHRP